jgi:hypothetical protein
VASTYEPLRDALMTRSGPVTWSFVEIDRLIGGLPPLGTARTNVAGQHLATATGAELAERRILSR